MSKTKTITITVKKGRHAEQPYTYTIDQGIGAPLALRGRFATRRNAKRSALRKLGVWSGESTWGTWYNRSVKPGWRAINGKGCIVKFINL